MAKINISFYDVNYSIEESSIAEAVDEFQNHLSTTMSGSGSVINFGGTAYNVDSAKLSSATSDFIVHLGNIAGNGLKVTIDGVEYHFDPTKVSDAVSSLTTALEKLDVSEPSEILLFEGDVVADLPDPYEQAKYTFPAIEVGKTYKVFWGDMYYPNLEVVEETESNGRIRYFGGDLDHLDPLNYEDLPFSMVYHVDGGYYTVYSYDPGTYNVQVYCYN